jgi:membrane protein
VNDAVKTQVKQWQDQLRNGLGVVRWYAGEMWHQFWDHNCINAAGALTYTTLFAVVPLMTVTYTFFSLIPEYRGVEQQVQNFVFQNFVPGSSNAVQEKLAEFADRAQNLTFVGFLLLFVTAFMMLVTIEKSFNTIWHVAEPRRGLQRFLLYWGVLSLGPAFVVIGMWSSIYLLSLPLVSEMDTFGIREVFLGYLPVFLSVAGFTVLYCAVPNCHVPFKHALAGGLVSMIVFQTAFNVFAISSRAFMYEPVYGTFAALPAFLVWLYLVWMMILMGAVFVRCLAIPRDDEQDPEPLLIKATRVLRLLHDAHQEGQTISDKQIGRAVNLNRFEHAKVFTVFKEFNLLSQTEDEHWILGRNLKAITLWDLYQRLPDGLDLVRLKRIEDLPRVVEPLISITQFGSNEMSVSLDSVFT